MTRGAWICGLVCLMLIGQFAAGGASGAVLTSQTPQQTGTDTPTPANETQHENPDNVDNEQYRQQTRRWLVGALSGRLRGSTIQISESQYERARALLDDRYEQRLGQYIEVTGNTDSATRTRDAFRRAQEDGQAFANSTERYERVRQQYQQARDQNDTDRARELARELNRIARNASRSGRAFQTDFATIENRTTANFTDSQTRINRTLSEINRTQAAIIAESLVTTTLTATAVDDNASYTTPASITGVIRRADGRPLANRTMTIEVAGQRRTVRTAADGSFALQFRPRRVPRGTQSLTVQYVPDPASAFLGSRDTVSVLIQQVQPLLTIAQATAEASYQDQVRVRSRLSIGDQPVTRVPVVATIGNQTLGRAVTNQTGHVTVASRLPASVDDGNRTLRIRVPYQERAIATTEATTELTVSERETTLSLRATASESTVDVSGQLTTIAGRPVKRQPLTIRLDNGPARQVSTTETGAFDATLPVPDSATGQNRTVVVRFANPGTNLANTTASATVAIPPRGSAAQSGGTQSGVLATGVALLSPVIPGISADGQGATPLLLVMSATVLILSVLVALALWQYGMSIALPQLPYTISAETTSSSPAQSPGTGVDDDDGDSADRELTPNKPAGDSETVIDRAYQHADSDAYAAAIDLVFQTLRDDLVETHGLDEAMTARELLTWARTNGYANTELDAIEQIVAAYERTEYAPTSPSHDRTIRTIESLQRLDLASLQADPDNDTADG